MPCARWPPNPYPNAYLLPIALLFRTSFLSQKLQMPIALPGPKATTEVYISDSTTQPH